MNFIDLNFTSMQNLGVSSWISPNHLLSGTPDGVYAIYPVAPVSHSVLSVYNNQTTLPSNAIITGFQIFATGYASGGTSSNIQVLINNTNYVITLPASSATVTVGSSGVVGTPVASYYNVKQPYFGYQVSVLSYNTIYFVDSIKVRVWYSTPNYLVGTRSSFSTGVVDTIPTVSNGYGLSYQVQSEQLNLLGDALFNIEQSLLSLHTSSNILIPTPQINSVLSAYTFSVTGTLSSPTSYIKYEKSLTTSTSYNSNLSGMTATYFPSSRNYEFKSVSGIAWIQNGATITPLVLSPNAIVVNTGTPQKCWVSFTAFAANPFASISHVANYNWIGYEGAQINSLTTIPSGVFIAKMFGLVGI